METGRDMFGPVRPGSAVLLFFTLFYRECRESLIGTGFLQVYLESESGGRLVEFGTLQGRDLEG